MSELSLMERMAAAEKRIAELERLVGAGSNSSGDAWFAPPGGRIASTQCKGGGGGSGFTYGVYEITVEFPR